MYYLLREVMTLLLELNSQLRTHSLDGKDAVLVFCFHLTKTLINCFSFLNGGCVSREDGTHDWILETNRVSGCICIT